MQKIILSIPDDIVFEVKSLTKRGMPLNAQLQLSLAIGMFVSQGISLARAAQLAEKNISDFIDLLNGLNIPAFTYTEDMLDDDLKFASEK